MSALYIAHFPANEDGPAGFDLIEDRGICAGLDELRAAALADAAAMPAGATIYRDPNVDGWAWQLWSDDYCSSGPVGHEGRDYGARRGDPEHERRIAAVGKALRQAGYTVEV